MRVGDHYFADGKRIGEQNYRTLEALSVHTDTLYTVTKKGNLHHYKTVRLGVFVGCITPTASPAKPDDEAIIASKLKEYQAAKAAIT